MEHHHQLAQEHDLSDGGGDANQDENRAHSDGGLHTSTIRRKLVLKSKAAELWIPKPVRQGGAKP
jgi:hypothetical protein